MATSVSPAGAASALAPTASRSDAMNLLVLWHLLSLDAPSVAMLWTWFLARCNHILLPANSVLAMGLAVWMLYAADRLLDARQLDARLLNQRNHSAHPGELEPRHHFHWRNRRSFGAGIAATTVALALLLPCLAPETMRLYLILGALLCGYFVLIHAGGPSTREPKRRIPKELAVGIFFSAAVFIPTVSREPGLRPTLLPSALLFAAVCSLNCLFIYAWEHAQTSSSAHPATRIAVRWLPQLALSLAVCGVILTVSSQQRRWTIPAACAIAATLLLLLHQSRRRLNSTTLRAAADLCLLTPLLLLSLLPN